MRNKETTVIRIDANPDHNAKYRARDDPGVAAILRSFGISKVEDYIYKDNKRVEKLVSYVMTVPDAEKSKYLINKIAQILPEFIDDDDKKVIDNAIDEVLMTRRQKRQRLDSLSTAEDPYLVGPREPNPVNMYPTNTPIKATEKPKTRRIWEVELEIDLLFIRFVIKYKNDQVQYGN